MTTIHRVDNGRVHVEASAVTGCVVALGHAGLGVELVADRRLADSWRLMVRMPDGITHVRAGDQTAPRVEVDSDAASMTLAWDSLATPDGEIAIAVRQTLALDGDAMTARLRIDNRSGHRVEELYALCIGGMADWERQDAWRMLVPGMIFGGEQWDFYKEFPGTYLGFRKSVWAYAYPGASVDYWQQNLSMPWASLWDEERRVGVYFGNHNPDVEFSVFWGELSPSADYASPKGRSHLLWPHPDRTSADVAIGATLGWAFFPLLDDGVYESPPVVVNFHEGAWREAAHFYRRWFEREVAAVPEPRRDGLIQHDAWQNTYLEMPDGRIRYRFEDLPKIARDALDADVNAIMIAGYHEGGLDTSYPDFAVPSRRLGTKEDLERGIAECQQMGVDVIMWGNANQISLDAAEYERWKRFANLRPDGNPHLPLGWGFDSLLGLMGVTKPFMVSGNMAHTEFRETVVGGWREMATWGAKAIQIDKLICGEPYNMDFNPEAPGHPMSGAYRGLLAGLDELHQALAEQPTPTWVALESAWDRAMPYGEALYCRFFGQDHIPVQEVTFPELKATCTVCGEFDYGLVNKSIRYGHIIALEGSLLWGTSADIPSIVPYVREVLRLRRALAQNLWWATVVEPDFARVDAEKGLRVGGFEAWDEETDTGTRHAMVLHHYEPKALTAGITWQGPYNGAVVHRPFAQPERVRGAVDLQIDRDEVVIVLPTTS